MGNIFSFKRILQVFFLLPQINDDARMYICNKRRVPKLVLIRQQIFCITVTVISFLALNTSTSVCLECVAGVLGAISVPVLIETAGCYLQSVLMSHFQALIDVQKMPPHGVLFTSFCSANIVQHTAQHSKSQR